MKTDEEDDSGEFKELDLLRPICLTSYDLGSLCMLGGSQKFLQSFNTRFLSLFDTSKSTYTFLTRHGRGRNESAATECSEKEASFSDNWIITKPPYKPELLYHVFLSTDQTISCLLSPLEERLALSAIAELDPNNILEYATNYRMWTSTSCWPPKMFSKARSRAKKFFHFCQIPLAVLCWANEFINTFTLSETAEPTVSKGVNDQDEILEVVTGNPISKVAFLKDTYKNALVTCINCAATVRNAPPAWIYIIKENKQRVSIESRQDLPDQ